jgi:hypothetical protein
VATIQQDPTPGTSVPRGRPVPRRLRVAILRVNPWSVLKFSLLFYLCLMLVILIGLTIVYLVVQALGIIDSFEDLLGGLWFEQRPDVENGAQAAVFRVDGGYLFRMAALIGIISVALWSALTVFLTFLYNLIADLVGGIEVTLSERR